MLQEALNGYETHVMQGTPSSGLWDVEWRVMFTAHTLMHVHGTEAGGYFEELWAWVRQQQSALQCVMCTRRVTQICGWCVYRSLTTISTRVRLSISRIRVA